MEVKFLLVIQLNGQQTISRVGCKPYNYAAMLRIPKFSYIVTDRQVVSSYAVWVTINFCRHFQQKCIVRAIPKSYCNIAMPCCKIIAMYAEFGVDTNIRLLMEIAIYLNGSFHGYIKFK